MKKILLPFLVLIAINSTAFSQHSWSVGFNTLMPMGDLRNDSPALFGAGFNLEMAFQIKNSPFYVGATTSFNMYGREKQALMLPPEMGAHDLTRKNYVANVLGLVRYKPQIKSSLRPFAEFSAGYSYAFTNAEIHVDRNGSCFSETEEILMDNTFTYGLGGGIEYTMNDQAAISLSFRSLRGGAVNYLTPSSMEYNQATDTYITDVRSSQLDYMTVSLSVSMLFGH